MLSAAVDDLFHPGQVISGRFRLERLLGRGGMGTVWEARHLSLETQIAIKFLNSDLSRRHDVLARFAREATSAASIRSPHVVSVLDSGFTLEGHGFIAMELLRGDDLGRRLSRFGTLSVSETALLVTQVCRGLAKAHAVNLVHRDLKPENIFIVDEDDAFIVKILDFGIAKSIGTEATTHKTDTGQLLGTPLYMSPEQALGRSIDGRSDLYSLAVVAYRCLTGRPPFTYSGVGEVIVAVSTHEPPAPSYFNADLSPAMDAWFAGALAKDPSARCCQTAVELSESFNRACGVALDGLLPPFENPRGTPLRQSYPPLSRGGSTELSFPSREEVATTIAAAQLGAGQKPWPKHLARRWWPLLATVVVAAAATTAFRSHDQRLEPAARKVVSIFSAVRTVPVVTATTAYPETPAVFADNGLLARPSERVPNTNASKLASRSHRPTANADSPPLVSSAKVRHPVLDAGAPTSPEPPDATHGQTAPDDNTLPSKLPKIDRDDPWQK